LVEWPETALTKHHVCECSCHEVKPPRRYCVRCQTEVDPKRVMRGSPFCSNECRKEDLKREGITEPVKPVGCAEDQRSTGSLRSLVLRRATVAQRRKRHLRRVCKDAIPPRPAIRIGRGKRLVSSKSLPAKLPARFCSNVRVHRGQATNRSHAARKACRQNLRPG
jgi:endogenous inhibitor of DNA gyrase (YacG/DUF329 family)